MSSLSGILRLKSTAAADMRRHLGVLGLFLAQCIALDTPHSKIPALAQLACISAASLRFKTQNPGLFNRLQRVVLVGASIFILGCSQISYLFHSSKGQLSIYNHERSIQEVMADSHTSPEIKEHLSWIPELKKYVESTLGVPATSNYQTFVDLKRPYVVWALTVAHASKLELKEWSFPFFGSFPYLGFFDEATANEWKKDYDSKGYDTYVRGVSAYSTLGYLRDPILSSMLSRHKADLVNLLFHETLHSQVYLKGEGAFNEQLASYFGDYGEKQWIVDTFGPDSNELKEWKKEHEHRVEFGKLLRKTADQLKAIYAKPLSAQDLGKQKEQIFRELQAELSNKGFRHTALSNNAALLAYLTYEDNQEVFELLNQKCAGNLKCALEFVKKTH